MARDVSRHTGTHATTVTSTAITRMYTGIRISCGTRLRMAETAPLDSAMTAAVASPRLLATSRSEATLAGHLDAEGSQRNTKMPTVRPEEGKKYDDFQLSYALDRLEGRVVSVAMPQKQASAPADVQTH